MTPTDPVADDEVVLRHIPGGPTWQSPPSGRASSLNFRLRAGEGGISVSRVALTTAVDVMARLGDPNSGSRIAAATVAEIRALGLDVAPAPIDTDSGHAEIRSASADLNEQEVRRRLAKLFKYVV